MIAIVDTGTTNTKIYITDLFGNLLSEAYFCFGCRDNISEDKKRLFLENLSKNIESLINSLDKKTSEIEAIIAFGMISSDLGIKVIPHIKTPAGLGELRDGLTKTDTVFFGNVPLYIIRGIKNRLDNEIRVDNVFHCDFMRGEETQCMGIVEKYSLKEPVNIITLGTHFKAVHIDAFGKITTSMTTMSGQIFESITTNTIVAKSVDVSKDKTCVLSRPELVSLAEKIYEQFGFNRSILLPRFMDSFTNLKPMDRRLFLDAIIAIDDIASISDWFVSPEKKANKWFLVGQKSRSESYKLILEKRNPNADITIIADKEGNREISILGALSIYKSKGGNE